MTIGGMAMDRSDAGLVPVLDGHNDVLLRLIRSGSHDGSSFFERGDEGHIDLPRAREGGFAGGLFSVYVSADPQAPPPAGPVLGETDGMPIKLPRPLEFGYAQRTAMAELGILHRLRRDSHGQ